MNAMKLSNLLKVGVMTLALAASPGVVLASDPLTGGGSMAHSTDPTSPPPAFRPRPASQDTGGPGRLAPPNGTIPNGTPFGSGSGPRPVIAK
jgi:hypothetical protein